MIINTIDSIIPLAISNSSSYQDFPYVQDGSIFYLRLWNLLLVPIDLKCSQGAKFSSVHADSLLFILA